MDRLPGVSALAAARAVARVALTSDFRAADPAPRPPGGESTPTELSAEARLLEHLLAWPSAAGSAVAAPVSLLASPPAAGPATALAHALQQGLEQSGLFYEAHLADWLHGARSIETLRTEPQGRLAPLPFAADLPGQSSPPAAGTSADAESGRTVDDRREPPSPSAGLVDPQAAPLVQQQLQTLDTQQLPWQGQIWPGQTLDWTVAPEVDPDQPGSPAEAAVAWRSTLRLQLPRLGTIEAQLRLSASGCTLHLKAPAAHLPGLRAALPELASALSDGGLRAERIVLSPEERRSDG